MPRRINVHRPNKVQTASLKHHNAENRPGPRQRGYDSTWEKVRAMKLAQDPYCNRCGKPGEDVHHIKTIATHPDLRLDLTNLETLCHSCHSKHTASALKEHQQWNA